jgi:hypothetical protein
MNMIIIFVPLYFLSYINMMKVYPSRPSFDEHYTCRRFETGGSPSRRVSVPRAPAQMGRARGRARRGESEVAGDGRERGGNPAAFVFVPRPGRVRLQ